MKGATLTIKEEIALYCDQAPIYNENLLDVLLYLHLLLANKSIFLYPYLHITYSPLLNFTSIIDQIIEYFL